MHWSISACSVWDDLEKERLVDLALAVSRSAILARLSEVLRTPDLCTPIYSLPYCSLTPPASPHHRYDAEDDVRRLRVVARIQLQ